MDRFRSRYRNGSGPVPSPSVGGKRRLTIKETTWHEESDIGGFSSSFPSPRTPSTPYAPQDPNLYPKRRKGMGGATIREIGNESGFEEEDDDDDERENDLKREFEYDDHNAVGSIGSSMLQEGHNDRQVMRSEDKYNVDALSKMANNDNDTLENMRGVDKPIHIDKLIELDELAQNKRVIGNDPEWTEEHYCDQSQFVCFMCRIKETKWQESEKEVLATLSKIVTDEQGTRSRYAICQEIQMVYDMQYREHVPGKPHWPRGMIREHFWGDSHRICPATLNVKGLRRWISVQDVLLGDVCTKNTKSGRKIPKIKNIETALKVQKMINEMSGIASINMSGRTIL